MIYFPSECFWTPPWTLEIKDIRLKRCAQRDEASALRDGSTERVDRDERIHERRFISCKWTGARARVCVSVCVCVCECVSLGSRWRAVVPNKWCLRSISLLCSCSNGAETKGRIKGLSSESDYRELLTHLKKKKKKKKKGERCRYLIVMFFISLFFLSNCVFEVITSLMWPTNRMLIIQRFMSTAARMTNL